MCKHVAAVLYGVGARLDEQPQLLFRLRDVDESELVAVASKDLGSAAPRESVKVLESDGLGELFGLDLAEGSEAQAVAVAAVQSPPAVAGAKESAEHSRPQKKRRRRPVLEATLEELREIGGTTDRFVEAVTQGIRASERVDGSAVSAAGHAELREAVKREVQAALADDLALLQKLAVFLGVRVAEPRGGSRPGRESGAASRQRRDRRG